MIDRGKIDHFRRITRCSDVACKVWRLDYRSDGEKKIIVHVGNVRGLFCCVEILENLDKLKNVQICTMICLLTSD